MIDVGFLNELQRFRIILKKKVISKYSGSQRSVNYGTGTELMDLREYTLGDDIRLIDWNVYARSEKLHVKRFREEKNLTVHVILDYSKSMQFGGKRTKYDYAAMVGLGIAYMSMKNNERFEFSAFSDSLYALKPRKGSRNFLQMVDMLQKLKPEGKSNFSQSVALYKKLITSRSLIVIISDFLFDTEELKAGLLRLGHQHEIKLVQVLDPEEIDMRLEGDVKLIDAESGFSLKTFFTNRTIAEYRDELAAHNEAIGSLASTLGARFVPATTESNIYDVFYELLR